MLMTAWLLLSLTTSALCQMDPDKQGKGNESPVSEQAEGVHEHGDQASHTDQLTEFDLQASVTNLNLNNQEDEQPSDASSDNINLPEMNDMACATSGDTCHKSEEGELDVVEEITLTKSRRKFMRGESYSEEIDHPITVSEVSASEDEPKEKQLREATAEAEAAGAQHSEKEKEAKDPFTAGEAQGTSNDEENKQIGVPSSCDIDINPRHEEAEVNAGGRGTSGASEPISCPLNNPNRLCVFRCHADPQNPECVESSLTNSTSQTCSPTIDALELLTLIEMVNNQIQLSEDVEEILNPEITGIFNTEFSCQTRMFRFGSHVTVVQIPLPWDVIGHQYGVAHNSQSVVIEMMNQDHECLRYILYNDTAHRLCLVFIGEISDEVMARRLCESLGPVVSAVMTSVLRTCLNHVGRCVFCAISGVGILVATIYLMYLQLCGESCDALFENVACGVRTDELLSQQEEFRKPPRGENQEPNHPEFIDPNDRRRMLSTGIIQFFLYFKSHHSLQGFTCPFTQKSGSAAPENTTNEQQQVRAQEQTRKNKEKREKRAKARGTNLESVDVSELFGSDHEETEGKCDFQGDASFHPSTDTTASASAKEDAAGDAPPVTEAIASSITVSLTPNDSKRKKEKFQGLEEVIEERQNPGGDA